MNLTGAGHGRIKSCVIIGSSRGLGAALVDELLRDERVRVMGVSRTGVSSLPGYERWKATGRYRHVELDIGSDGAATRLRGEAEAFLGREPLTVIFNAAVVRSEIIADGRLDFSLGARIDRVGIEGLRNTLEAFQDHWLAYGGALVGISSFSAFLPPIAEVRVAYPAGKAYLDMTLRCLRRLWKGRISVCCVHLGHLAQEGKRFLLWRTITSYGGAARLIVRGLSAPSIPKEINSPLIYALAYKWLLRAVPEEAYGAAVAVAAKRWGSAA